MCSYEQMYSTDQLNIAYYKYSIGNTLQCIIDYFLITSCAEVFYFFLLSHITDQAREKL